MVTVTNPTTPSNLSSFFHLPAHVVVRILWQNRRTILRTGLFFAGLGILLALLLPSEYRSEARIMPEMNTGGSSVLKRLSNVAALADIDLSETDEVDAVRPDLYPSVLQSTPFVLYLLRQPVVGTDGQPKSIADFLDKPGQNWWPFRWATIIPPVQPMAGTVRLTEREQKLAEEIGERVNARLDTRSGIIIITVTMPDPNLAAAVTQLAMNYLTRYVTDYRTDKARKDLQFYHQQFVEARNRYHTAKLNVSRFDDNHRFVYVQASTIDRHRLETELDIARTMYTDLSRSYERARLTVQERTPVFKVLEPPKIPLKRSSPKRGIVVFLAGLFGMLAGTLYVLIPQTDVVHRFRLVVD